MSFHTYRLQKVLSLKGLLLPTSKDIAEKNAAGWREQMYIHIYVTRATSSYRKKDAREKDLPATLKQDQLRHS